MTFSNTTATNSLPVRISLRLDQADPAIGTGNHGQTSWKPAMIERFVTAWAMTHHRGHPRGDAQDDPQKCNDLREGVMERKENDGKQQAAHHDPPEEATPYSYSYEITLNILNF